MGLAAMLAEEYILIVRLILYFNTLANYNRQTIYEIKNHHPFNLFIDDCIVRL
jgi:hypothetical protein